MKYKIKGVLVPVDFSEVAGNALQTAIAICKRQLATITLVHVVENTYHLFPPEAGGSAGVLLPRLLRDARENLENLAKALRAEHELVISHVVQSGNPADEICSVAFRKSADLIVMGTHGAKGLSEFFLGSNAYRVVKNAQCPVMTIPANNQWLSFRKILFPVRMVPQALEKYEYVRTIIRMNGSSLVVAGLASKSDPASYVEMEAMVDSIKQQLTEDNVICNTGVHVTGNVAKTVLEISEREKPDLVVITATLDTALKDFFLGPYTQDIVNHARYPVLSIRPGVAPGITEKDALHDSISSG